MEKKKISTTSLVFWIAVLVVLFVDIFLLPKSGNLVLLDETFDNFIIIIFLGYIIYKVAKVIKKNNGIKRVILILIIIICSGIIIYLPKNIILDVIQGPVRLQLYNTKIYKRMTTRVVGLKYYVIGEDINGKRYSLEISSDDADRLSSKYFYQASTIEYYKNTERVVSIS